METKEEKQVNNVLTEREKIELRKEAYKLAFRFPFTDNEEKEFVTFRGWIDYKSREIYNWLLEGKN